MAAGFRGVIFDLDGTVYLGDALIPGAAETIRLLQDRGVRMAYLSNKPIETREAYAAKLTRLGIPTDPDTVVNSSFVMAGWLRAHAPGARVFVIGEPPLIQELAAAGCQIVDDPARVELVVAALDRTFDYRKLSIAMEAIKRGARFVATNPDRTCPMAGGEIPDCAAVIGAIEGCTGHQVETIAGKPSPLMLAAALDRLGLPPANCLIVGDRLETDVLMGQRAGVRTALVLTGVTRRQDLATHPDLHPDYILASIRDLPDVFQES
ncbi:MAG: HAD-IIA family hydrolase [Chloroflexota bacterium]